LDGLFAGSLRQTQALLTGPSLPPAAVIAHSLVNELAELEREFILVLDDIHVLRTTDIYDLLAALLRHPLPGFHLLLLTRQNPPLALGVLRAYDQLSEIRGRDLRFTVGETAAFMDRAVALPLRDETLAVLAERTEGWAVGLRLAALRSYNSSKTSRSRPTA
jgi:LuxR family transcriptional regulator, maltose regulon positive regulatory protein